MGPHGRNTSSPDSPEEMTHNEPSYLSLKLPKLHFDDIVTLEELSGYVLPGIMSYTCTKPASCNPVLETRVCSAMPLALSLDLSLSFITSWPRWAK
jgi:hypothetical protein